MKSEEVKVVAQWNCIYTVDQLIKQKDTLLKDEEALRRNLCKYREVVIKYSGNDKA